MLKLKLQYFGHMMQRADSFEKTLMLERLRAGGEGENRGWDSWMASPTQWTWVWVNSRSWCWTGRPGVLWLMGSQRVGYDWVTAVNLMLLFGASQVVLAVKNPPANVRDIGDAGLIPPGSKEDPGGEHGNLLQYSCLENTHRERSLVGYSP